MATIDPSNAVDRIRLSCGDYRDPEILTDAVIQYYLDLNSGNETATTIQCAYFILGYLSRSTHERLDRIELWGSEAFNNYLKYIQQVIKNPSGAFASAGIYAGGVDLADVVANENDTSVVPRLYPFEPLPWDYIEGGF